MGIVSIEDAKLGHAIFLAKVGRAEVLDRLSRGEITAEDAIRELEARK